MFKYSIVGVGQDLRLDVGLDVGIVFLICAGVVVDESIVIDLIKYNF